MAMKPRIFLAVATSLWSGHLGIYLLMRWKALHPIEDKRYAELRQKWGTNANLYMFGMFHWQGALIMIFRRFSPCRHGILTQA